MVEVAVLTFAAATAGVVVEEASAE